MITWFRDFFRGYSDKDVVNASWKCLAYARGIVEDMTDKEILAAVKENLNVKKAQRILKSAETIERLKRTEDY
jgi:hypothetical protein